MTKKLTRTHYHNTLIIIDQATRFRNEVRRLLGDDGGDAAGALRGQANLDDATRAAAATSAAQLRHYLRYVALRARHRFQ
jgi:hypothetical protein